LGKWKKKTLTWHDEQDVPLVFVLVGWCHMKACENHNNNNNNNSNSYYYLQQWVLSIIIVSCTNSISPGFEKVGDMA
jgi:hypothetical protein